MAYLFLNNHQVYYIKFKESFDFEIDLVELPKSQKFIFYIIIIKMIEVFAFKKKNVI